MLLAATRYRDTEAALGFLKDVIGMEELAVHRDDDGAIRHAELRLGDGLFMFGPDSRDSAFSAFMISPQETGGRETTTQYAIVDDVAGHHDRAVAAGAEIIMPLKQENYGGETYSLRCPEGHIWTIGSYDPRVVS
ncbi:VOC family protein [Flavimaricola marinus]|uniref:Glyoxalase-like domain protein n=1 Tax=Flavimaricola marinus TaxID=1819565 RepID=A0A238LJP7_9RHOB|nr:VOC family protein [Flavimaricola marinus]SMY09615.1 Glyoxalase-like domain protein [Flavimaricola marinus]